LGTIIVNSDYDVYSDTLLVVILDAVTSIFAGFAIFSIIGHLAYTLNTGVDKVAASGKFSNLFLRLLNV